MKRISLGIAFAAFALFISGQTVAPQPVVVDSTATSTVKQDNGAGRRHRPRRPQFTAEQMTKTMTEIMGLDEKQTAEVEKLNKKYSKLIEGLRPRGEGHRGEAGEGHRGGRGGGMGGHRGGMGGHGGGMGGMFNRGDGPNPEFIAHILEMVNDEQEAYDKKLKKILNEEQMETYTESIKQHFASQWMVKEFLMRQSEQTPPAQQ